MSTRRGAKWCDRANVGQCARTVSLVSIVLFGSAELFAQGPAIAVQQPVVGVTGVATTVSVPDRGRATLGSVSRAASGRTSAGFGLKNRGRFAESSQTSISVGVTIHDFEAMDRAALSKRPASATKPSGREAVLSPRAAHAWSTLQNRR